MIEMDNRDWKNIKKRYDAWWDCEIYDRVVIQAYAPKDIKVIDDEAILELDKDPKTKWSDLKHIIKREKARIQNTYFAGEAIPFVNPNWSVGNGCLIGCVPHFSANTVWVDPLSAEINGFPKIEFQENSYWWNWIKEFTEKATRESEGNYYLIPQFGNSATDTLAMIRDSQEFMFDVIENPEWVKNSLETITCILNKITDILWEKSSANEVEGYLNWYGCWSPGKTLVFDADVSCMVSPQQFKDVFLPTIIEKMNTVQYRQFHVDGESLAKAHLDTLLSLPELQAIQWMPGDGKFEVMQWVPLIKKIQESRKSVQVYATPEEIIPLLKEVSLKGLCISTNCNSESEANRLIENVEKLLR